MLRDGVAGCSVRDDVADLLRAGWGRYEEAFAYGWAYCEALVELLLFRLAEQLGLRVYGGCWTFSSEHRSCSGNVLSTASRT